MVSTTQINYSWIFFWNFFGPNGIICETVFFFTPKIIPGVMPYPFFVIKRNIVPPRTKKADTAFLEP